MIVHFLRKQICRIRAYPLAETTKCKIVFARHVYEFDYCSLFWPRDLLSAYSLGCVLGVNAKVANTLDMLCLGEHIKRRHLAKRVDIVST